MNPAIVGSILVGVFLLLALLHVFWALGGSLGTASVVPETDGRSAFQPGLLSTLAVAAALFAAAGIAAWRSGLLVAPGPTWIPRLGIWVLGITFLARAIGEFRLVGFFKSVRGTRFARLDDRVFSPLCLLISALSFFLATTPFPIASGGGS